MLDLSLRRHVRRRVRKQFWFAPIKPWQYPIVFWPLSMCAQGEGLAKRRVSIKDIAYATGVSHPTVSRALRGEGRISVDTRNRILATARTMGYSPSLVARGLVTQRSR